ncbi:MAG: DUF4910 domain-containing protein [Thermoanaerobaculia bacterium]|nr:DUF4910 domain-containing protein [Thermoanaerobaculia bacterium]
MSNQAWKDGEGRDEVEAGESVFALVERAFPICRSITGNGVRETLRLLQEEIGDGAKLEVREIPTGTQVFDWRVPKEWNVRGAWIDGPGGQRVVDFADHNLHLLNYSMPFRGTLGLEELKSHLYSDPDRPTVIPYRTSYYQERWGFCLPHEQLESLPDGDYEVVVDTTLEDGHLTLGEVVLPGESEDSVLLSAHVCHPSLANDNLSALGVTAHLVRRLAAMPRRRYTYRIVLAPGTIGAIVWLAHNEDVALRIRHGLVLANLGDGGGDHGTFHYKRCQREDAVIDRAVVKVLEDAGEAFEVEDFSPFGYDERQYCSPGFDLPVGSLAQTPWGRYPEYHSSADNLDLIRPEFLGRSLCRLVEVIHLLENNRTFRNLHPKCEPQLGNRGLYSTLGGGDTGRERQLALLWVLNQSDGTNSLLDIAERSGKSFRIIQEAAAVLVEADLLEPID